MTNYLLRKILEKYNKDIVTRSANNNIKNSTDINQILLALHQNKKQIRTYVNQIEVLAKMCQIYSKQGQLEELEKVEHKILYLLGYEIIT